MYEQHEKRANKEVAKKHEEIDNTERKGMGCMVAGETGKGVIFPIDGASENLKVSPRDRTLEFSYVRLYEVEPARRMHTENHCESTLKLKL